MPLGGRPIQAGQWKSLFATMERLDAGGTKRVRLLAAPRGRLGALGQTGIGERTTSEKS
jgi:hypothetical protein